MNQKIKSRHEFVEQFLMLRGMDKKIKSIEKPRFVNRYYGRKRGPDAEELNRMYNGMGMSAPQIAKECDISQSYTRALLKKYGIRKIGYNGQ